MEQNHFKRSELEAWWEYSVNKPCPKHPNKLIKKGKWGNYCGEKDELGRWCGGESFPTKEFISKLQNNDTATS